MLLMKMKMVLYFTKDACCRSNIKWKKMRYDETLSPSLLLLFLLFKFFLNSYFDLSWPTVALECLRALQWNEMIIQQNSWPHDSSTKKKKENIFLFFLLFLSHYSHINLTTLHIQHSVFFLLSLLFRHTHQLCKCKIQIQKFELGHTFLFSNITLEPTNIKEEKKENRLRLVYSTLSLHCVCVHSQSLKRYFGHAHSKKNECFGFDFVFLIGRWIPWIAFFLYKELSRLYWKVINVWKLGG